MDARSIIILIRPPKMIMVHLVDCIELYINLKYKIGLMDSAS